MKLRNFLNRRFFTSNFGSLVYSDLRPVPTFHPNSYNMFVDEDEVERAVQEIAEEAYSDGLLNELTYRDIRRQVERKLDLDSGILDSSEYKALVKSVFKRETSDFDFDGIPSSPAAKPPPKKVTAESKKRKPVYKSAEFIPTDSEDEDMDSKGNKPGPSQPKKGSSPKKSKLTGSKNVNSPRDEGSDTPEDEPKPKKRRLSKENAGPFRAIPSSNIFSRKERNPQKTRKRSKKRRARLIKTKRKSRSSSHL